MTREKPRRDIIVIGAPVGGGAAIAEVISHFPADLEASVFVVLHATAERPILLADILNAPGRLRAAPARNGEPIERRRIYIAADGRHLLLGDGAVHLSANGSEPHHPSIDLLFTSAAETFRERVIAVLLLHVREDGVRGLLAVRAAGGLIVTHRNEQMREGPKHPKTGEALSHVHVELDKIARRVLELAFGAKEENR